MVKLFSYLFTYLIFIWENVSSGIFDQVGIKPACSAKETR